MSKQQRELEVTVISAENLKNVNWCGATMNPFVEAWIYPTKKMATTEAKRGGVNPHWNSVLRFICDEDTFQHMESKLTIHICNYSRFSHKTKVVGTVNIPLVDIRSSVQATNLAHPFKYQVRIPSSGRFHGVLTVSVKLLEQGNYTSGRTAPGFPPTYNPMNYQFPCGNNQQPYPPPSPMPYPPPSPMPYYPPYPPECPTQPPHSPYPQTYDPSAWHF